MEDEEEGHIFPVVREHREGEDGGRYRAQAQRLVKCDLRHHLIQLVDKPTHDASILDLIWTNDTHLISSTVVEDWQAVTDQRIVLAHSTYGLGKQEVRKEEVHLLESSRRLKILDFHKADWCLVQSELRKVDWSQMEWLEPTDALVSLFATLLPILEENVPAKKIVTRRSRPVMDRKRRQVKNQD